MTNRTMTVTVTYEPIQIHASRPEGDRWEPGVEFTVRDEEGLLRVGGTALPPEGDSVDCWLHCLGVALPRAIVDAVAASVSVVVDDDERPVDVVEIPYAATGV